MAVTGVKEGSGDIATRLSQECDKLPVGADLCKMKLFAYVDVISADLGKMTPVQVCQQIDWCVSDALSAHPAEAIQPYPEALLIDLKCSSCQALFAYIYSKVGNNLSGSELVNKLKGVCSGAPTLVKGLCNDLVLSNIERIASSYDGSNPTKMCQNLRLCSPTPQKRSAFEEDTDYAEDVDEELEVAYDENWVGEYDEEYNDDDVDYNALAVDSDTYDADMNEEFDEEEYDEEVDEAEYDGEFDSEADYDEDVEYDAEYDEGDYDEEYDASDYDEEEADTESFYDEADYDEYDAEIDEDAEYDAADYDEYDAEADADVEYDTEYDEADYDEADYDADLDQDFIDEEDLDGLESDEEVDYDDMHAVFKRAIEFEDDYDYDSDYDAQYDDEDVDEFDAEYDDEDYDEIDAEYDDEEVDDDVYDVEFDEDDVDAGLNDDEDFNIAFEHADLDEEVYDEEDSDEEDYDDEEYDAEFDEDFNEDYDEEYDEEDYDDYDQAYDEDSMKRILDPKNEDPRVFYYGLEGKKLDVRKLGVQRLVQRLQDPGAGGIQCQICQWAVSAVEAYISQDDTEQELARVLQELCTVLPGNYASLCQNFVVVYMDEAVNYVIDNLTPPLVCNKIDVCPQAPGAAPSPSAAKTQS